MIPILLLAAGESSRMRGADKLLEELNGKPLLQIMAERALAHGPVYVTLPAADHPRHTALPKAAQPVIINGAMSDSIKAGIAALPDTALGVVILPADMPDITADDIGTILTRAQTSQASIIRATTETGDPGHPIYFARRLFPDFADLNGDNGATPICKAHAAETEFLPLNGNRARLDLDTPEEWLEYRRKLTR